MSIRNLASPPVIVTLADDSTVKFSRMTVGRWAELADEIRRRRIQEELKALGAVGDATTRQTLRLRAMNFEPSLRSLIGYCESPAGIRELLKYAAKAAGETEQRAADVINVIAPGELFTLVDELIHMPAVKVDPTMDGPTETANPTSAGGSSETTGGASESDGSQNPNPSTGSISLDELGPSTDSTSNA